MILQDALGAFLSLRADRHLSDKTIVTHGDRLGRFVFGLPGDSLFPDRTDQPLAAVTSHHIHDHFLALRSTGLASATLAGYKASHRTFWPFCQSSGWIEADPAAVLLDHKDHQYSYEPVNRPAIPRDDLLALVEALPGFVAANNYAFADVRDAAFISLTVDSAARRGELYNLQAPTVRRALQMGQDGFYLVQSWGKTGVARIRFGRETASYLEMLFQQLPADSRWLWLSSRTYKRVRPETLSLNFTKVCIRLGLPVYRPHSVRKRTVTDIIEQTGDPKIGQLLANHKDPRTTAVWYNEVTEERVAREAAKLAQSRRNLDLADEFARFFKPSESS
ncbi:MAG: site-specific integrase [Anaerolineales bacterium]|nr:site-specific integrase [Anaerolineales bacterium]